MACGCCMEPVKDISCDVNRCVETEGHISAVDIVVDSFRESDNIKSLIGKQLGGLVSTVSAESQETIQLLLLVGLLHIFYFVDIILTDDLHHFEGLALSAEDSAALSEYTREC